MWKALNVLITRIKAIRGLLAENRHDHICVFERQQRQQCEGQNREEGWAGRPIRELTLKNQKCSVWNYGCGSEIGEIKNTGKISEAALPQASPHISSITSYLGSPSLVRALL